MHDYASDNSLKNHIHKSNCGKQHIPYTQSNFFKLGNHPWKCEFDGCNGSYSTKRSREIHYNNKHGLLKSHPGIIKPRIAGNVCKSKRVKRVKRKVTKSKKHAVEASTLETKTLP